MNYIKNSKLNVLFFSICFLFFFIFFAMVYPLVPYDGDDWAFLSFTRPAYPIWGSWNPIKILPETLMPFCGYLSAYIFNPVIGDYITSITISSALIVSLFITIYFYCFYKLISFNCQLSNFNSLSLTSILIFLHFIIFKSNQFDNIYMFYSGNLICYFHYLIPAILNSILVLFFLRFKNFLEDVKIFKNALLLFLIYLSIFSNIFHSIILVTCISTELLFMFFKNINSNSVTIKNLKTYLIKNISWVFIVSLWFISLLFEANGGRAHLIGYSTLDLPIHETLTFLNNLFKQISKHFFIIAIVSVLSAFITYKINKTKIEIDYFYKNTTIKCLLSFIITLIYIILVSAKANPSYINRADVSFSFLFYLFIIIFISLTYIFQKYYKAIIFLPIFCFIIATIAFNTDKHFRESNSRNIPSSKCIIIDNLFIQQIVNADSEGKNKIELDVPKGDNIDNWPHPYSMGSSISKTLYVHGLISRNMIITVKPNENINKSYNLGYLE